MPKSKKKKELEVIVEFTEEKVDFVKFVEEILSWPEPKEENNK